MKNIKDSSLNVEVMIRTQRYKKGEILFMRAIKKSNTYLLTTANTNPVTDSPVQTPIEIALQIDENGMTTASNLYAFLELDLSHFSRWCNKNIINNKFAIENEDYFPFAIDGDRYNPKPKTDYKITSDFAKKLSMTGNTERHEQARQYFIACEQGLKIATQKLQNNPQNNMLNAKLIELLTSMDNRLSKLEDQSAKKRLPEKKYSHWKTNSFNKLNALLSYVNEHSDEKLKLSEIIHLVIEEVENTYDIEMNDYVDAYKSEFDLDTNPYTLDVINRYKDLKEIFTCTLDSIMEKLHIADKSDNCKKNIFDELAAKADFENKLIKIKNRNTFYQSITTKKVFIE